MNVPAPQGVHVLLALTSRCPRPHVAVVVGATGHVIPKYVLPLFSTLPVCILPSAVAGTRQHGDDTCDQGSRAGGRNGETVSSHTRMGTGRRSPGLGLTAGRYVEGGVVTFILHESSFLYADHLRMPVHLSRVGVSLQQSQMARLHASSVPNCGVRGMVQATQT